MFFNDRPKGHIWPKVPGLGPVGSAKEACQACRDLDPGYLSGNRVYVSVTAVGPVRLREFCQIKST